MNENKGVIHTDLAAFDAHVLTDADYAEIPEITDEMFARGVLHIGGVPVKRGRPKLREPKRVVNLRLSKRVVDTFRAGGPGWQTRINAALESWLGDHPDGTLA
jgi:uncharacterized protein (DUF4415 family)